MRTLFLVHLKMCHRYSVINKMLTSAVSRATDTGNLRPVSTKSFLKQFPQGFSTCPYYCTSVASFKGTLRS